MRLEERFKSKLGPKDPVTGCIEWTGYRLPKGYGQISVGGRSGKMTLAHRLAWTLKHGPIPEGMKVLHSCDNPPCCNEDHLFLGSTTDNISDKVEKGRCPNGQGHYKSSLTETEVAEIRRRVSSGEKQRKIAADFGVSDTVISKIKSRSSWASV